MSDILQLVLCEYDGIFPNIPDTGLISEYIKIVLKKVYDIYMELTCDEKSWIPRNIKITELELHHIVVAGASISEGYPYLRHIAVYINYSSNNAKIANCILQSIIHGIVESDKYWFKGCNERSYGIGSIYDPWD